MIKFIKRDEYLTNFEKLNGEKDFLLNSDIKIQELWLSEDFYLKLGLKHMQDLIKSNSYSIYSSIDQLFEILGNSFDRIKFLKSLNLNIQCNPINYQPKYKWSKDNSIYIVFINFVIINDLRF